MNIKSIFNKFENIGIKLLNKNIYVRGYGSFYSIQISSLIKVIFNYNPLYSPHLFVGFIKKNKEYSIQNKKIYLDIDFFNFYNNKFTINSNQVDIQYKIYKKDNLKFIKFRNLTKEKINKIFTIFFNNVNIEKELDNFLFKIL